MQKRKPEPAERVTRRVRAFRKRQREALKQHGPYLWGLRDYFRQHGLAADEWALAHDVYTHTEVLSLRISFERFIVAIRGDKTEGIPPVKNIELSTLVDAGGAKTLLIRPVKIPARRRRK
jgi:hypothetical protein